jgi:hypothetical protein
MSGACGTEPTCPGPTGATCADASTLRTTISTPNCAAMSCTTSSVDVTCVNGCAANACTAGNVLVRGLGGPTDFGMGMLGPGDDSSSMAIALTSAFPMGLNFYGTFQTSIYVNNNGNASFGVPLANYNPASFTVLTHPMIAPFFADVDTRGGGAPMQNTVSWFTDARHVYATWHLVGYYAMHTGLLNSFQIAITERSDVAAGDFDVELRYEQCQWTTGDASGGMMGLGGTPARAGFAAGDGLRGLELPGAGTAMVLNLCTTSNVGVPGVWRYAFRSGNPT